MAYGLVEGRPRLEGILRRAQQNVADHENTVTLAKQALSDARKRLFDAEAALAAYDREHDAD